MPRIIPTEQEALTYFQKYSNWGRWGKEDQAGTLNLITEAKRIQAAKLVRDGGTVSCALPIVFDSQYKGGLSPALHPPPVHFMIQSGEQFADKQNTPGVFQTALDYFAVCFHSHAITHLDSLAHMYWGGKMYNGVSSSSVNTFHGATVQSIDVAKQAVITRGVFLDMVKLRGDRWPENDEVFAEDLESAEHAQGVKVEPGDALLVRTGVLSPKKRGGGMNITTISYLHERGVAVLGRDALDARMPGVVFAPVHQIGIVAMGLWLLDHCGLEDLAAECAKRNRWEFLFTMGPLRIQGGTGSPTNPIAVF